MPSLSDIHSRHSRYQDSMLYAFEGHLREIVQRAQARVIARLQQKLSITDGSIDPSPRNLVTLRNAGKMFMEELDAGGYQRLVNAFIGEFRGTLPFLQETLGTLGEQVEQKWGPPDFTQKDLNLLTGMQVNTAEAIESAIESVAGAAVTRGLFGVAGLRFGALVEMLTERFETSIGKARTIADTGMSVWYATASDRAFQIIEKDLPEQELKYRYSGPDDVLTRPFCEDLLGRDKGYSREQIEHMNNGQLPNVFFTRGGWNCRHQWILDVRQLEADVKEPAVAARQAA